MKVTLNPSGAVLDVQPHERILDAARRLGYDCPQSCRNGNCHICAALLVEGRVQQGGVELSQGELFTCLAEPLEDCVLHWDGVLAPGELQVRELACQVVACDDVGGDVFRLRLQAPAGNTCCCSVMVTITQPSPWLRRRNVGVSWNCMCWLAMRPRLR